MSLFARLGTAGVALATLAFGLAGCVPASDTATVAPSGLLASPSPTVSASSEAPSRAASSRAASSPVSSTPPSPSALLPTSCGNVYSASLRATLEQTIPPLNDPGVTLLSTDQASLLEVLDVVPTLRCTWGTPSERGMSTNVSIVGVAQAAMVRDTLRNAGFACEEDGTSTFCRLEQRGISLDDVPYERGETHAVSGAIWVTTSWVNVDPPGYTEDILSTVGG